MRRDFHGSLVAIAEKITRNTSDADDSSVTSKSGKAEISHMQKKATHDNSLKKRKKE